MNARYDELVAEEYAKHPARAPYSKRLMPYALASDLGTASAAKAQRRAWDRYLEETGEQP